MKASSYSRGRRPPETLESRQAGGPARFPVWLVRAGGGQRCGRRTEKAAALLRPTAHASEAGLSSSRSPGAFLSLALPSGSPAFYVSLVALCSTRTNMLCAAFPHAQDSLRPPNQTQRPKQRMAHKEHHPPAVAGKRAHRVGRAALQTAFAPKGLGRMGSCSLRAPICPDQRLLSHP